MFKSEIIPFVHVAASPSLLINASSEIHFTIFSEKRLRFFSMQDKSKKAASFTETTSDPKL
ncbi:hypothetical protein E6C60_2200 [Paenibacillus algicola]|uniref:Uncharacterized protein n=1 Tax=Paenibacillus algicola TaxID=2565926 RepID=A0A4P8XKP2_9BACL|nr:hypothetical protein E6C60_2200 [Paenibacillus algicola]